MFRKKKSLRAAAESTHTAADRRDAADRAVQAISDYVETFSPYLTEAQARVQPLVSQAQDRLTPLVQQAQERVEPYATQARKAGAHKAQDALDALTPKLNEALEKVTPTVEAARDKVQSDLIPRLHDALEAAGGSELVEESTRRGKATVAALKGEIEAPKEKKGALKTIGTLALIAGLAGAAYVAFKKFFARDDSNTWNSYDSTSTFARTEPSNDSFSTAAAAPATEEPPAETFDRIDPVDDAAGEGMVGDVNEVSNDPDLDLKTESGDDTAVADTEQGDAASETEAKTYGEGAYVGSEPPEGFSIKGNERSMKYHLPDSGGYDRTIADVWFLSEAAAEAAGFTRAQR